MNIINLITRTTEAERSAEAANNLYQIQEFNGELWLTFSNALVCPCSMLKDAPVDAVMKMRQLFVERNNPQRP